MGDRVRAWRIACGRSQQQLADAAGLAVSSICQIELNRQGTSTRTLSRLTAALGVTMTKFYGPLPKRADVDGGTGRIAAIPAGRPNGHEQPLRRRWARRGRGV